MSKRTDNTNDNLNRTSNQFIDAPSSAVDVILGVLTQLARKYLFIDVFRRAIFYACFVIVFSLIPELITLPDDYYIVQV